MQEGTAGETGAAVADAVPGNWVDHLAPPAARPYLRLARADRPIGAWLLLWPCWWSVALAARVKGWDLGDLWHLALLIVGAFVMRGAGCTYNDILDRDIDAKVERTRSRPLPSGQVGLRAALAFLAAQALLGLAVLLQFNRFTVGLGLLSLLPVAVYPLMKRITYWPQTVLGLSFGWGALMGWAAAFGTLSAAPLVLYAAAIAWIIGYDTIYAHQDKEDDALIGVKSTALRFGERTKPWLTAFYALFWLGALAAGKLAGTGSMYLLALVLVALHLAWQVVTLETSDPANCLTRFRSNHLLGAVLFLGLIADALLPQ